jgi:hypothetical protein
MVFEQLVQKAISFAGNRAGGKLANQLQKEINQIGFPSESIFVLGEMPTVLMQKARNQAIINAKIGGISQNIATAPILQTIPEGTSILDNIAQTLMISGGLTNELVKIKGAVDQLKYLKAIKASRKRYSERVASFNPQYIERNPNAIDGLKGAEDILEKIGQIDFPTGYNTRGEYLAAKRNRFNII